MEGPFLGRAISVFPGVPFERVRAKKEKDGSRTPGYRNEKRRRFAKGRAPVLPPRRQRGDEAPPPRPRRCPRAPERRELARLGRRLALPGEERDPEAAQLTQGK